MKTEKLELIKRIRAQTLCYSIRYLSNMYMVNLRTLAILCEEGVFLPASTAYIASPWMQR